MLMSLSEDTIIVTVINFTKFFVWMEKENTPSAGSRMPVHVFGINFFMNSSPSGTVELYS